MMAGAGAVAPFMFTVTLNEAIPIGPVARTEIMVLLTVPVTASAATTGLSPQMYSYPSRRISSRRQRQSAFVAMRVPSIFLKGSGSFGLAVVSELAAGSMPTGHPALGFSALPHMPEPVDPPEPPVLEPATPEPPVPPPPVPAPPVAPPPVPAPPVTAPPVLAPPVATPPVATPPVATPPVATPPVATPPVATAPPVATPPVDCPAPPGPL